MPDEQPLDFDSATINEIAEAVIAKRNISLWTMPLSEMIDKLIQLQKGFGPNTEIGFGADYERNVYLELEPKL